MKYIKILFLMFIPCLKPLTCFIITNKSFCYHNSICVASCLNEILNQYYTSKQTILISSSEIKHEETSNSLSQISLQDGLFQTYEAVIKMITRTGQWPMLLYNAQLKLSNEKEPFFHNLNIMHVSSDMNNDIDNETIQAQLEILQDRKSWDSRGKFVVIVHTSTSNGHNLALKICDLMWTLAKVFNIIVLVSHFNEETELSIKDSNMNVLNIFTWFPYDDNNCGEIHQIVIRNQWLCNEEVFSMNSNLFPSKVPRDLHGCPFRISTLGIEPYVILTKNDSNKDESPIYKVGGLALEYINLSIEKMNLTAIFFEPTKKITFNVFFEHARSIQTGKSDILVGTVPFMSHLFDFFDPTIIYIFDSLKWIVPCPRAVPRMEKIWKIFTLPVWIMTDLAVILVSVIFYFKAKNLFHTQNPDRHYNSFPQCLGYFHSLFVGVSMPVIPKSANLRFLFITFCIYCFSFTVIFQTFFTTYLVDPGYEERIEAVDELGKRGIPFGFVSGYKILLEFMGYEEFEEFVSSEVVCEDIKLCLKEVLIDGNFSTITSLYYPYYIASKMGVEDIEKAVCFIDETLITGGITAMLQKGSPLLNRLNTLLRHCMECGLLDKYWSELNFGLKIKKGDGMLDDNHYFVFSILHLQPIFLIFLFGLMISFIAFITEFFFGIFYRKKAKLDLVKYICYYKWKLMQAFHI
ncbi:Ionotropic receptor 603 [Blattella germanica]|nr:Ionotropic receptor 603 [Blattella germanica]